MKRRVFAFSVVSLLLAIFLLAGCVGTSNRTATRQNKANHEATVSEATGNAQKDVNITDETSYYDISGDTAEELRAQMSELGPNGYDGYTVWEVNWSYPYEKKGSGFTTGPVEVNVDTTITLPMWEPFGNAPDELIDRWVDYLAALKKHEDGHRQNGIDAAREVLQTLKGLPAFPTREELEQAADAAGEAVLSKYRERDVEFDENTQHGITQGARFP